MKLYYSPGACSLAGHIALEELGLAYQAVRVDLKTKRTETGEDFTAINPKGYVPALGLDEGGLLTENIAILAYIAERGGGLMPKGGLAPFRVLEMTAYISGELHKNFKPFFNPAASDAERDEARAILARRFQLADDMMGERAFIAGDEMTIADCYLFVTMRWARGRPAVELPPRLAALYDRLAARPAVVAALAQEDAAAG